MDKTIDAIPTPRADFCMAISDDSNNIVVFGGRTSISPQTFVGTIYILDISTTSWKQGPSLSFSRIYSACTIVGNQFVAWGGSDGNNTSSGTPLVYDLTSNLWVNNYTAPAYYANAPHPSSGSGTSSTGSGGNGGSNGTGGPTDSSSNTGSGSVPVGAIAGGVVGALLVGVLGATLFFVRKRKIERARTEELAQKKMLRAAELTNNFQERNNDHDGRSRTVTTTSVPVPGSGSPPDYTTREVISPIPQTLKMKESGNYNNPHTTYINTVSMTGIGNNSQDFGSPNLRRNPQEVQEGQFNDYHDQDSLTRSKNPQAMNSGFSQQNSADVSFYEDLKL
ncbi:hypothetical protein BGZ49_001979 [Haplosporangium sp. Z 27]|nr:hypothetical protein BGZ49_001979 [Haplosporangium sp. Z 27]